MSSHLNPQNLAARLKAQEKVFLTQLMQLRQKITQSR